MSDENKRHITMGFFITAIAIICSAWGFFYFEICKSVDAVEAKQFLQDTNNVDIKSQLSQIQTDISWIKTAMSKEAK